MATMSLNSVGRIWLQRLAHALRLELEDADRVAAREHLVGLRVVEGDRLHLDLDASRAPDDVHGVLDHVEVAQPEEVHLQQADLLDRAHRVLGHDLVLALRLAPLAVGRAAPRSSASCRGTISSSGRSAITTAAAWIELLRTIPSRPWATSTIRLTSRRHRLPCAGPGRASGSRRSSGCGP